VASIDFSKKKRYLGTWYEIAANPLIHETIERNCACVRAEYALTNTTNQISVYNTCSKGNITGPISRIKGVASINTTDPAKLQVSFPSVGNVGAPYWVLHIEGDYQQAIVWGCQYVAFETLWILSRTPTISPALYSKLHDLALQISGMGDEGWTLEPTLQQGCTYPQNRQIVQA
jgi:apolipoprotein D and lipocalin family protein